MGELPAWIKHATVWLLLGLGLTLGVQAWQAREQATRFVAGDGGTVSMERADDGHYHWPGRLAAVGPAGVAGNGREIDFLVDTGATATAVPLALAQQLGLPAVGQVQSQTAGGLATGTVVLATLELAGGVRIERIRITALPGLSKPLLGMDVLGRMRWVQEGGTLKVQTRGPAP
jgi:aspartyl protease family protein